MQNAGKGVHIGVRQLLTESLACSSVKTAAQSVCVFHPALLETEKYALATTTGRLSKAVPSALDHLSKTSSNNKSAVSFGYMITRSYYR